MKKLILILFFIPLLALGQTYTGDKFNARVSMKTPLLILNGVNYTSLITGETNATTNTVKIGIGAGENEVETAEYANIFIGYQAGRLTTTGASNLFMGYQSGYDNLTGNRNIFLGYSSGQNIVTGSDNIALGYNAATQLKSGSFNVFLGRLSGSLNKYGSSNIYIGPSARYYGVANSNELVIDNQARGAGPNDSTLVKTSALIYGIFDATVANQELRVNADLTYDYRHAVAYAEGVTYTPNVVQNVYFKLTPTFTTSEADGITVAGDSITIVKAGDYYLNFSVTLNGGNGEDWRFKLYKNNVALAGSNHVTTTGAGNYVTLGYFWYILHMVAGDDLSFKVTNTTNSNNPTITDIKFYIRKEPE